MQKMLSSSLVSSAPKEASHNDELFMKQTVLFSENLNELKNLRKQLYSAAEYFEISYSKEDQKQFVVETLKDYVIKAVINTVDHLGSVAYKVDGFLDEKVSEVSEPELRLSCLEQRLRTCRDFSTQRGLFQHSFAINFPKHHKRYILPGGATTHTVGQSALIYHNAQGDLSGTNTATTRETSPTVVSEEYSLMHSPESSPGAFQFTRIGSKHEKRTVSPLRFPIPRCGSVKRSSTLNSSSSAKLRYPSEPRTRRSASLSLYNEGDRTKDIEVDSSKNKRFYKALLSMGKSRNDTALYKYLDKN
ncbi:putative ABI family protein [Rosa chinensis]|uniref:Putative ABI family protein n=1 Tax=Rosa chinensis TaxID=74649 RepID=A0A2P6P3W2_ROSCH|nr:protein ABIL2 [Rosa chinensis]XP_024174508.1 protein ABIL2 [Rosa chinensis]XP_024174509.1 protein ABIL2 [Rosa chinensis]XP_024174510.1 protein ABIL2 [Rosa chinensis]XP_024174511.1 protein ABIL2 [Rosa chinensis]XP_024174512.1 protein ABIL2 [Rosa chinensis]XP_040366822.1 protein ABIL2 [Rosa chinensis]XP_040366823.1 protein ABIL2 [Rosa chinensis]XP_040366824.1 protein ABIL2 [Rosa chinensis]PRQ16616.1 putative ABI family protein [Rosa chinensis]